MTPSASLAGGDFDVEARLPSHLGPQFFGYALTRFMVAAGFFMRCAVPAEIAILAKIARCEAAGKSLVFRQRLKAHCELPLSARLKARPDTNLQD